MPIIETYVIVFAVVQFPPRGVFGILEGGIIGGSGRIIIRRLFLIPLSRRVVVVDGGWEDEGDREGVDIVVDVVEVDIFFVDVTPQGDSSITLSISS